jgi:DNA-binding response OmpR family regulator
MADKLIKILLVEDDPLMQRLIQLYMKQYPAEIEMAGNGRIACKRLKENEYDLLITDLQMPEVDGATLIRSIRKEGNMLPVIVLSSYDKESIERMIDESNIDSLRKPFESADLIWLIDKMTAEKS